VRCISEEIGELYFVKNEKSDENEKLKTFWLYLLNVVPNVDVAIV
jgi:hypothetical protein